ncbi:MAG: hypothetical protein JXR70_12695 [Spirochaetales bacterium]|nr:hypothetical protein [Spirochaetales bacterium]
MSRSCWKWQVDNSLIATIPGAFEGLYERVFSAFDVHGLTDQGLWITIIVIFLRVSLVTDLRETAMVLN